MRQPDRKPTGPRNDNRPAATSAISRITIATFAAALLAFASSVQADEKLARARQCFACHKLEGRLVGPSYRDVAARYREDPAAVTRLAAKIRTGGAGAWGTLAMAPNPAVTEADALALARWVLAQK